MNIQYVEPKFTIFYVYKPVLESDIEWVNHHFTWFKVLMYGLVTLAFDRKKRRQVTSSRLFLARNLLPGYY